MRCSKHEVTTRRRPRSKKMMTDNDLQMSSTALRLDPHVVVVRATAFTNEDPRSPGSIAIRFPDFCLIHTGTDHITTTVHSLDRRCLAAIPKRFGYGQGGMEWNRAKKGKFCFEPSQLPRLRESGRSRRNILNRQSCFLLCFPKSFTSLKSFFVLCLPDTQLQALGCFRLGQDMAMDGTLRHFLNQEP